jgi:hypothetical protein
VAGAEKTGSARPGPGFASVDSGVDFVRVGEKDGSAKKDSEKSDYLEAGYEIGSENSVWLDFEMWNYSEKIAVGFVQVVAQCFLCCAQ